MQGCIAKTKDRSLERLRERKENACAKGNFLGKKLSFFFTSFEFFKLILLYRQSLDGVFK